MRCCLALLCTQMLGCATLHHVQIGEIDNRDYDNVSRFEVNMGRVSIDADNLLMELSNRGSDVLSLFSMGPRTGTPGGTAGISGDLLERLLDACPSGKITGLTSTRESTNYAYAANESVRVSGFCIGE